MRVSPAAATEQKHYQKNNQYGFDVGTSVAMKEAGLAFVTVVSLLHYAP